MYTQKRDANNQIIQEAVKEIVEVEVSTAAVLTDAVVTVPAHSYGFIIKRAPVFTRARVNGQATAFITDEGDRILPVVDGIQTLTLTTYAIGSNPIVLHFIR